MLNETLGTIDVVWDLSHLYSGQDDPRIQEDLSFVKKRQRRSNLDLRERSRNFLLKGFWSW